MPKNGFWRSDTNLVELIVFLSTTFVLHQNQREKRKKAQEEKENLEKRLDNPERSDFCVDGVVLTSCTSSLRLSALRSTSSFSSSFQIGEHFLGGFLDAKIDELTSMSM